MTRETSDMIFAGLDCVGKLQMWMVCCVQSVQQPHFDAQLPTSKTKQMAVQRRVVLLGRIGQVGWTFWYEGESQSWQRRITPHEERNMDIRSVEGMRVVKKRVREVRDAENGVVYSVIHTTEGWTDV